MTSFTVQLNKIAKDTNDYLKKILYKKKQYYYLLKPIRYSVFSGGKRFRSSIIINAGKIFSINYKNLITVGAAVECIHVYSLIHARQN